MNLKPCPYRHVGEEGHILCDKIKTGDREVSPNICRACPISQINCAHLRATLDNESRPPIVVRWGNGKTQVWDEIATQSISLQRAACAAKVTPIHSARDCAGCALRQPLVAAESILSPLMADRRPPTTGTRPPRVMPAPMPIVQSVAQIVPVARVAQAAHISTASTVPPITPPTADARTNIVAKKIIQLQEWLAKSAARKSEDENSVTPLAMSTRPVRAVGEEKRVGWTD